VFDQDDTGLVRDVFFALYAVFKAAYYPSAPKHGVAPHFRKAKAQRIRKRIRQSTQGSEETDRRVKIDLEEK